MARKIWPRADRLYQTFLSAAADEGVRAEPDPGKIDRLFAKAVERRTRGRAGLYMQSRFPVPDRENGKTCAPYSVFHGFSDLFEDFDIWLTKSVGGRVHGHLFGPGRVEFAGNETVFNGALTDSAALRDYNPRSFLTSLIWNTRGERQCFQFSPRDNQDCNWFMATDPNAQISVITGAWAVPLLRAEARLFRHPQGSGAVAEDRDRSPRASCARCMSRRGCGSGRWPSSSKTRWSPCRRSSTRSTRAPTRRLTEVPRLVDLTGFASFLQTLQQPGDATDD